MPNQSTASSQALPSVHVIFAARRTSLTIAPAHAQVDFSALEFERQCAVAVNARDDASCFGSSRVLPYIGPGNDTSALHIDRYAFC